jgi:adenylate kinase
VRVVFLGAPGVGKGTQAVLLCERHGWKHFSSGDLLRDAVARKTPLGLQAKAAMDRGDLVEDSILLGLIEEAVAKVGETGFVLDGYPRNVVQARNLDEILARRKKEIDRVVLLSASVSEVLVRLEARGRPDDTPETVHHRLGVFEEQTAPLIGYYESRGLLRRVDGMGAIEDIHQRVEAAVAPTPERT